MKKGELIGFDVIVFFSPIWPGLLWLSSNFMFGIIMDGLSVSRCGALFLLLSLLLGFPAYCLYLYWRQLVDNSFYPALLYFALDMVPTFLISGFLGSRLQKLTGWEGDMIAWVFFLIGAGILFAAMWLVSECIFRWVKKRA